MTVACRPFYLHGELTVVITAVYILPDAKISTALTYLHDSVNRRLQAHPDRVHIIGCDFSQACLKTVFPKFVLYVQCYTSGNITLDCVSSNLKHAYRVVPLPHLGLSKYLSLLLILAYTPLRRKSKQDMNY